MRILCLSLIHEQLECNFQGSVQESVKKIDVQRHNHQEAVAELFSRLYGQSKEIIGIFRFKKTKSLCCSYLFSLYGGSIFAIRVSMRVSCDEP